MKVRFPLHTLTGIIVLAAVVFACDTETRLVGSRYVKSLRVDPMKGATLAVSAAESPELDGTVLVIPPGALASETTITVELGFADLIGGEERAAGPVAVFGPAGLTFSSPARLTLPVRDVDPSPHALFVEVREANGERFRISGADLEVASDRVSFDVNGFTSFQPGRQTVQCASDSDCAQGETCVNGGCTGHDAGTPACQVDGDCPSGELCHQGACVVDPCPNGGCCHTDSDCAANESCIQNLCHPNSTTSCQTTADCPAHELCTNGVCGTGPCSPLLQNCPAGTWCFVDETSGSICAAYTDMRSDGQTCNHATDCITGLGTTHVTPLWCGGLLPNSASVGLCRPYCDTTVGMASCQQFPLARSCLPIPGAAPGLGYCANHCNLNSDCTSGEMCDQGSCVPCPNGTCAPDAGTPACQAHTDCPSGKVCLNNGLCSAAPGGCNVTAYCPLGTSCVQGHCT